MGYYAKRSLTIAKVALTPLLNRHATIDTSMTERKKLVIIMGVQRSGTTVLFNIISSALGITACQEAVSDEIYDDFFLRPEKQIRDILHSLPGTVLLKPVRESERRSPLAVAQEYQNYDLKIIWLYRDPVNVYRSYNRLNWCGTSIRDIAQFSQQWNQRNLDAIADSSKHGQRMIVVRYEDLVKQPDLIIKLAAELEIQTPQSIHLRKDSAEGRRSLSPATQLLIDLPTKHVQSILKKQRSILPAQKQKVQGASHLVRLQRWISTRRRQATTSAGNDYKDCFPESNVQALLDTSDHASLYRSWRTDGAIRHERGSDELVAIGFEACQLIHIA